MGNASYYQYTENTPNRPLEFVDKKVLLLGWHYDDNKNELITSYHLKCCDKESQWNVAIARSEKLDDCNVVSVDPSTQDYYNLGKNAIDKWTNFVKPFFSKNVDGDWQPLTSNFLILPVKENDKRMFAKCIYDYYNTPVIGYYEDHDVKIDEDEVRAVMKASCEFCRKQSAHVSNELTTSYGNCHVCRFKVCGIHLWTHQLDKTEIYRCPRCHNLYDTKLKRERSRSRSPK